MTADEAMAPTNVTLHFRDGGSAKAICWALDADKVDGALVHVYTDDEDRNHLFILQDPSGTSTDYRRERDGEMTDGIGFFGYINESWAHKHHFKNNDPLDLRRSNWEQRNILTKQQRRLKRSTKKKP